jgi:ribosome-binding factor A
MSLRADRVASLVKEEAGMFIALELNDSSTGFVTVMEVQMSPDLKIAKIYVSVMGSPQAKEKALERLEEIKGSLRSHLGSHLRLKFTPSIQFYLDETMERVDKINRLIQQIHKDDAPKPEES